MENREEKEHRLWLAHCAGPRFITDEAFWYIKHEMTYCEGTEMINVEVKDNLGMDIETFCDMCKWVGFVVEKSYTDDSFFVHF